jgi:hypothetical protein
VCAWHYKCVCVCACVCVLNCKCVLNCTCPIACPIACKRLLSTLAPEM